MSLQKALFPPPPSEEAQTKPSSDLTTQIIYCIYRRSPARMKRVKRKKERGREGQKSQEELFFFPWLAAVAVVVHQITIHLTCIPVLANLSGRLQTLFLRHLLQLIPSFDKGAYGTVRYGTAI